jgi:hypothetical protein
MPSNMGPGSTILLNHARLALDGGLLDFQVGDGLHLDRELVGEVVALDLPSFVVLRAIEIPTHL